MSRGYQVDPIREYAAGVRIANCIAVWERAEEQCRAVVVEVMASGVRAEVVAERFGWSRATLYRWLAADQAAGNAEQGA